MIAGGANLIIEDTGQQIIFFVKHVRSLGAEWHVVASQRKKSYSKQGKAGKPREGSGKRWNLKNEKCSETSELESEG